MEHDVAKRLYSQLNEFMIDSAAFSCQTWPKAGQLTVDLKTKSNLISTSSFVWKLKRRCLGFDSLFWITIFVWLPVVVVIDDFPSIFGSNLDREVVKKSVCSLRTWAYSFTDNEELLKTVLLMPCHASRSCLQNFRICHGVTEKKNEWKFRSILSLAKNLTGEDMLKLVGFSPGLFP